MDWKGCTGVLVAMTWCLSASQALAGAFQLNERSSAALGASLSGSVSSARDVTFSSFNPAALTTVESLEFGGSFSIVSPISDATILTGPFAGTSLDADKLGLVPSISVGYRITEDLVVGFNGYSPFGLKTEYPPFSPVQADARKSELMTISLSPTISYDISDAVTVGASLDVLYADVRLTNAAVDLEGDRFDLSFSVGALISPVEGTQIGVAYHHGYDFSIRTSSFGGFPGVAEASLPNWVHLGITQTINDDLRVMAEGRWINWIKFDSIDITTLALAPDPLSFFRDVHAYEDAFFLALGAEYDINDQLTLRSGIAYDETPTSDAFRTARVPDEDRLWLSIGASYIITESASFDLSYSYLHSLSDPDVTLRNGPLAGTQLKYDGGAHIFSVGGSIRF